MEKSPMATRQNTDSRALSPRHPIRDLALDLVFGIALITAGLAGFVYLVESIGGGR
jgi:hypothetical protein